MRLKGKVAIVTGGAHGMGEAEARLFATEGAKVVVADILGNEAEAVAADIRVGDGEAIAATIDVTSEPEWGALIGKTLASYGRLDVLVNNAGISGSSVGDPDGLEGWHRIIAVNQTSVFVGTKLAAEQMAKTGGGSASRSRSPTACCSWPPMRRRSSPAPNSSSTAGISLSRPPAPALHRYRPRQPVFRGCWQRWRSGVAAARIRRQQRKLARGNAASGD